MVAVVKIWGKRVGAVMWDANWDVATFEYDVEFKRQGLDLSPLHMPIDSPENIYTFPSLSKEVYHGLPGLLADALPDRFGLQIMHHWLIQHGRVAEQINSVERLCMAARRSMGALEFEPDKHLGDNRSSLVFIEELIEQAHTIWPDRTLPNSASSAADDLTDLIRAASSVGGQRAKALLAINESTGEVRSGQTDAPDGFRHWLIKLDGITNRALHDPKNYGRIEYAYYLMAQQAGIEMSESTLLEENNRAHFLTLRFDRTREGKKLHLQTLSALAHLNPYDGEGWSYEDAFQVMRLLKLDYAAKEQMFLRAVFNVVAANYDDHTKNISFLMNEHGQWKLAPAYDLTYSHSSELRGDKRHQLSIQGKRERIERADVFNLAKEVGVKKPQQLIDAVLNAVDEWPSCAKNAGIPNAQANIIRKGFNWLKA
jgi:serine/threonine-protein kinase HipA